MGRCKIGTGLKLTPKRKLIKDIEESPIAITNITEHITNTSVGATKHWELSGISSSDHHTKYTNAEAVAAVEAAGLDLDSGKDIIIPSDGYLELEDTASGSAKIFGGQNAYFPNEVIVQPSSGNNMSGVNVAPSGTDDSSSFSVLNASDLDNFGYCEFGVNGTQVSMFASKKGTGTTPTWIDFNIGRLRAQKRFGVYHQNVTLSSDVGAITHSNVILCAESGVTDDCTQLTGAEDGDIIIVRADAGDTITLKDGTDMIIGGDIALVGNNYDAAVLLNIGSDKHLKLAAYGAN